MDHTMQMRPRGGDVFYAPGRDITALLPVLIRKTLLRWEPGEDGKLKSDPMRDLIVDMTGVTDEELCEVAEALASFMSNEVIVDSANFSDAMQLSGVDKLSSRSMAAVYTLAMEDLLAVFWDGIRTATKLGPSGQPDQRQFDPEKMADIAERLRKEFFNGSN